MAQLTEEVHDARSSLPSRKNAAKTFAPTPEKKLGVLIRTRDLTLSNPDEKCNNLVAILLTKWHSSRKRFTMREVASLLGLVANLYLTTQWSKHTFTDLHHTKLLLVKFNLNTVIASGKFKHLTNLPGCKNINIKNFYLSKFCKTVCNSKEKINIIKPMRAELSLLASMNHSLAAFC